MKETKLNLSKIKEDILKLDAGLEVENSALLCPNPSEFYKKAYLSLNPEDFYIMRGIKEKTKITNVTFKDDLLQGAICSWNANGSNLDAKTIEVCKFNVMEEVCIWDLETSFVADLNPVLDEVSFFNHYWDVLGDSIGEAIATTAWIGSTAGAGTGLECEGFIDKIEDSLDVIGLTASGTFSVSSVEAEFEKALLSLPSSISRKKSDLRFYVSPHTANLIAIASAKNNTSNYVTRELDLFYLGIKISVQDAMPDNTIVLTRSYNLVYAVNIGDEGKNLRVTDLSIINEPKIRTRVNGHIGFEIRNDDEIVYIS